jgi:hypothetical protein
MTVMLRMRTDDYNLGPTLAFMQFQQELARLAVKDGKDFPHVFGIIDLNEKPAGVRWVREMAAEAREALRLYKKKLSDHSIWVLGRLAGIGREHRPKRGRS